MRLTCEIFRHSIKFYYNIFIQTYTICLFYTHKRKLQTFPSTPHAHDNKSAEEREKKGKKYSLLKAITSYCFNGSNNKKKRYKK